MDNSELKIGLVGLGYWGKNIARNLYELGRLNAICDSNLSSLNRYKDIYTGIKTFSDVDDLISSNIDAIFIATPAITHASLVRTALEKGIHVFV